MLILDLCGGTGAWSKPYRDAGYEVQLVDLPTDIRLLKHMATPIHGILAAPPCTYFCTMRRCRGNPTDEQLREGLSIVDACLRFIWVSNPVWWALENPSGSLHNWLGPPVLKFQPWEYGDPWTKRTWLWGKFNIPTQTPVVPHGQWVNSGRAPKAPTHNAQTRSITPPGFAQAFFKANP